MAKMCTFYVMVSVKLDNEWNEWVSLPGFSLVREGDASPEMIASLACKIVDRKRDSTVKVEVLNRKTKLYDLRFEFGPIVF